MPISGNKMPEMGTMHSTLPPRSERAANHAEAPTSLADALFTTTQEAERVLREHQTTVLSERDQRTLLAALDNPPSPAKAALKAAERYRKRIANAG